jgi:hypothetical protein
MNARDDRTVLIGGPTYKGEDTARRERYAAAAVQNGLMDCADAVLDSLLDPQKFDLCDIV